MANSLSGARLVKRRLGGKAGKVAANEWTERLIRFGYAIKGVIYIIPGILALQLALGQGGTAANQTSAIQVIGSAPFGPVLLVLVAVGLLGYSMWGFIRALFDPFYDGNDAEGIAQRFGYVASAIQYAMLLIATMHSILGVAASGSGLQDWSATLLSQPFGRLVVGIIGIVWMIGGGLMQIYKGYKADFWKDLKTSKMSPTERQIALIAGRVGLAARGVAFTLIALFLVQAAVFADPTRAKALDGVLLDLSRRPYGQVLLALTAVGLIAFGIYSIIGGIWTRLRIPGHSRH